MVNPVIILGCGPAGLLAAHACAEYGAPFKIYSRPVRSRMYGAMYLHTHIPDITPNEPTMEIEIIKVGVQPGYAENVYGDPTHQTSWARFEPGIIDGWSLEEAYDRLWHLYSNYIIEQEITYWWLQDKRSDIVFNTVPKKLLCNKPDQHLFTKQDIWVRVQEYSWMLADKNVILYNGWTPDGKYGDAGDDWYRYSQIQGFRSWEYSHAPGDTATVVGFKPIHNNCDCAPFVHHIGRFGKWRSGVLTHHAFEEAVNVLAAL